MQCRKRLQTIASKARIHLPILFNLLIIILLVVLDIRDLIYKTVWIGPADSFSFQSGSSLFFDPEQLVPVTRPPPNTITDILTANASSSDGIADTVTTSGWSSFLSRCEKMYAFRGDDGFFLSTLSTNCMADENTFWPQVVFTASIRVDSMVWASCQLLPAGSRPPICYEEIASEFLDRYHFPYPPLLTSLSPPLAVSQEAQLQRLLHMVSDSLRVAHRIICVEITDFGVDKWLQPFAFGCAVPNVFRSEFVFFQDFWNLVHDKAWITMDVLQVAGFQFGIRQNCKNQYIIHNTSSSTPYTSFSSLSLSNTYRLKSQSEVNFSSNGHLYAMLLTIDAILLVLNVWSSIEILKRFIAPEYTNAMQQLKRMSITAFMNRVTTNKNQATWPTNLAVSPVASPTASRRAAASSKSRALEKDRNMYYSFFSRSLYRNTTIAILTIVTQCLSWFIILPNSVVWTWSESTSQKIRAYQSSIRVWVLLVLLVHLLWDAVVSVNERLAYQFVRRTYLTSIDIILIVMVVSVWFRQDIFQICEIKWHLEGQRINDVDSFPTYVAHGNTFSVTNHHVINTPLVILWTIYKPLVLTMSTGVGVSGVVSWIKFAWYSYTTFSPSKIAASAEAQDPSTTHSSRTRVNSALINAFSEYRRLPMEVMLDSPIRARSLIRNALTMETNDNGRCEIRPSCYVDFGVVVDDGFYRSRTSFSSYIKPLLPKQALDRLVGMAEPDLDDSSFSVASPVNRRLNSGSQQNALSPLPGRPNPQMWMQPRAFA